jgi:hypothetical protein
VHLSKQKVTELIPGKKVVWHVSDSRLSFVKEKSEWNDTEIKAEVRFTWYLSTNALAAAQTHGAR